jgi:hypothetical protein
VSRHEGSGWGWKPTLHPDDLDPLLERWRTLLLSGEAGEIEARFRRHDAVYRWFLVRAEPLRDELGNIVRWYGTSTDIDDLKRILNQILEDAPSVAQARAKVSEAQRNLDQAQLNLRYTDVLGGVITRRDVNPGNNVVAGQGLMAIRSLTDIWVDANFKETQLSVLRIGHPADLYVDMYGKRRVFKGRVSGFTMGTCSTLALLPPENATGNFMKVVQRLPVRIDLVDYDPDKAPPFLGLSVRPYVHVRQTPTGPDAGKLLQPYHFQPAPEPSPPQTERWPPSRRHGGRLARGSSPSRW